MKYVKNIGIICVWIALWAVAAWAIGSPVILASPLETAEALVAAVSTPTFWLAIGGTLWHVGAGLVAACLLGCVMGILAARWRAFDAFINPAMHFVKSAPIVCFIVLMLVWFGSTYVDFAAVVLAVLPVYFFSMYEAYQQRDAKLVAMLRVFRVPFARRMRLFEWPSVRPFFTQSTKIAVGMSWKSGVTAELIGLTFSSIGEQIYLGKLTLDTAGLLMWTFVIVVLGWACEKAILALVARIGAGDMHALDVRAENGGVSAPAMVDVQARGIDKSFGDLRVLREFSYDFKAGSRTCLMAPTGTGKTTLLNVLLGIEKPDAGSIEASLPVANVANVTNAAGAADVADATSAADAPPAADAADATPAANVKSAVAVKSAAFIPREKALAYSVVFQEARLLGEVSSVQNVSLIAPTSPERAATLLTSLLDESALDALPAELSGGMKRCVEICRALAAPSNCVIMDEPFAGLDDATKQRAIALIERELAGRTLILVTHDRADAEVLGCDVVAVGE